MPDTQPSASALSDNAILNIAYKRTWLRAVSFKSDEIIDFVRAIEEAIAALPAPVSEPIGRVTPEHTLTLKETEHLLRETNSGLEARARLREERRATQAVVAQPVDTEIACKAARYDWLVKNCFDWAAPGDGDSFDHIELHFEHELLGRDDATVGEAIDSEIAREQSPQAKTGDKHE